MNEILASIIYLLAFIIYGSFLPVIVLYFVLNFKKQKLGFKLILKFILRLFLILLLFSVLIGLVAMLANAIWPEAPESSTFVIMAIIGGNIGFWGGVISLIIRIRRSRKQRTQKA